VSRRGLPLTTTESLCATLAIVTPGDPSCLCPSMACSLTVNAAMVSTVREATSRLARAYRVQDASMSGQLDLKARGCRQVVTLPQIASSQASGRQAQFVPGCLYRLRLVTQVEDCNESLRPLTPGGGGDPDAHLLQSEGQMINRMIVARGLIE